MVHLVKSSLAAGSHPPLGSSPLFIPQLPLSSLVTEYLDLAVTSVSWLRSNLGPGVVVCINLNVQWKTFDSFLCTEIN